MKGMLQHHALMESSLEEKQVALQWLITEYMHRQSLLFPLRVASFR
eukprot:CAMPEP_0169467196 /NCGR_PEP_ID=MMETSP1042-20121227/22201_1 /TAXON_ID=464988 /ORGANISM="Hemiselmis andersenii, Strain CCMP1180" /LENGTH=45 /DNA_ID= /DNA_START= /DNA_END= /DNA_ORIENTATION=